MDNLTLMRERIQHVQETGQPLRPAYNELKSRLGWIMVGIAAVAMLNLGILAWLIEHTPT